MSVHRATVPASARRAQSSPQLVTCFDLDRISGAQVGRNLRPRCAGISAQMPPEFAPASFRNPCPGHSGIGAQVTPEYAVIAECHRYRHVWRLPVLRVRIGFGFGIPEWRIPDLWQWTTRYFVFGGP